MYIINKIAIVMGIAVIAVIVAIGILLFFQLDAAAIQEDIRFCKSINGTSLTYSGCHCIPRWISCDGCHEAGTFCVLPNGTEVRPPGINVT